MVYWLHLRKKCPYFLEVHTETSSGTIPGICFQIFQTQGMGRLTGGYGSKKTGHVFVIIKANSDGC